MKSEPIKTPFKILLGISKSLLSSRGGLLGKSSYLGSSRMFPKLKYAKKVKIPKNSEENTIAPADIPKEVTKVGLLRDLKA